MINVLMLTGSFFMLEIYDRVLPSRSVPTLVGLIVLAIGLYMAQGILDLIRGRILGRVGTSLDEALNARVFDTIVRLPLTVGGRNEGLQPLRDLDNVRSFLGGMGPSAFFDLPWLPFYLLICFAFHVMIGLTALVGAIILVMLTVYGFLAARFLLGHPSPKVDYVAAINRPNLAVPEDQRAWPIYRKAILALGERDRDRMEAANRFLKRTYLPAHNRRFKVAPSEPGSAWRTSSSIESSSARLTTHEADMGMDRALETEETISSSFFCTSTVCSPSKGGGSR